MNESGGETYEMMVQKQVDVDCIPFWDATLLAP